MRRSGRMVSCSVVRRDEIGAVWDAKTFLLAVVVRMSRLFIGGNLSLSWL